MTDDSYIDGTIVLLSSFLEWNPWFRGDIVVTHDGLSESGQARLAAFPRCSVRSVSTALQARASVVADAVPALARKRRHFYALDAFALRDYDKVLKVDSDIVCTGDVSGLLTSAGPLSCCRDRAASLGQLRNLTTYAAHRPGTVAPPGLMAMTFNTGVMAITPGALDAGTLSELYAAVHPATFAETTTPHADSVILNRCFRDRWTPVSERYNYLVSPRPARHRREMPIEEAALIHVLGHPKPWDATRVAAHAEQAAAFEIWDRARARAGV